MEDKYYMMWLSRINGIGIRKAFELLKIFGSAQEIWNAPEELLLKVDGIGKFCTQKICSSKNMSILKEQIHELEIKNISFISIFDSEYPKLLKEIYDPPIGFYYKGVLPDNSFHNVSMVGSRRCSAYGSSTAFKFSKELAEKNVIITSGMATGIDSATHRGTLRANGMTTAVLGCGVDVCYPKENFGLMEEISQKGCLISEYPPGVQ